MNKRLLTLDDLCEYYSHRKKSMKFSSEESGEPIVVQIAGTLKFEDSSDLTAGLTPVRLQACHTERNLNRSSISYEVMHDKLLPTFKNRPILGYIHDVDGVPQFYGHNAHEEDGEIVYDEIAVGNIPETNNAELVYDEENDRYNVMIDGYLYDEYTKATEIVKREEECPCSVEISIKSMSFNAKDHTLIIEDGYFSGVAILGYDNNGNKVQPGMAGSNVKLKDFSMSNNSTVKDKAWYGWAAQLAGMFSFYDVINGFKQVASTVTDLNTQITELAKVSEQSSAQIYNDFTSYADIAKEVRGTISDTISATADWSKNGYSIPDSKQLAEVSQLYKNVGDGINIDEANESLISTLQGFKLGADQAEHIVDVFNEVSNNEAISSGGIGDALQRSAASFNAANTSLEKSVALITATRLHRLVEYMETYIKNIFNCHRSLYYYVPQYRGNYYMTV